MSAQPHRITIVRGYSQQNDFTVVIEGHGFGDDKLTMVDGLAFDEMLGVVARLMIPAQSDGSPNRQVGTPLFLAPIKEVV